MKINVNIYNEGKIFGIKTPVYNFPMDYNVYSVLKELGVAIEVYTPKKEEPKITPVQESKIIKLDNVEPVVEEQKIEVKDEYTEEELSKMTNNTLKDILHNRGHYSMKTGARDKLAPKFKDTKEILIKKVLSTNKK